MIEPSLLGSVVLNTEEVFFPVVHVVLKGPVTVVAVIPPPHGSTSRI
jgi:homoserine kinase